MKSKIILLISFNICFLFESVKCLDVQKSQLIVKKNPKNYHEPIAINAKSFTDLIQRSAFFIDQTPLIQEVLATHHFMIWLAPDNWGKSINLNMIKTFFEIEVDVNGNPVLPTEETINYKLFANNTLILKNGCVEILPSPLLISKQVIIVAQYLGKVPVIYVTFQHATGANAAETKQKIKSAISLAFGQHEYMINVLEKKCTNYNESCDELNKFKNYLNEECQDLEDSLAFLGRILENHFHLRSIMILDDYDTPVFNYLQNDIILDDWKEILNFTETLIYNTLDLNQRFFFMGIIAGTFKLESGENFKKFYLARKLDPISEYFGITFEHLRTIFQIHKISITNFDLVKLWYNGQRSAITKQAYFNPTSIANYLKHHEIVNYCKKNITYTYIQKVINGQMEIRHELQAMVGQANVFIHDDKGYWLFKGRFNALIELLSGTPATHHQKKSFYWYLLSEGYLRRIPNSDRAVLLNYETTQIIANHILSYCKCAYSIKDKIFLNAAVTLRDYALSKIALSPIRIQQDLTSVYKNALSWSNVTDYMISSIFHCVALQMHSLVKFDMGVYYNKTFVPILWGLEDVELVIVNNHTRLAVVVVITRYNTTASYALDWAYYKREIFLTRKFIRRVKMIGINIVTNKTVQVLNKMMNWWTEEEYNMDKETTVYDSQFIS